MDYSPLAFSARFLEEAFQRHLHADMVNVGMWMSCANFIIGLVSFVKIAIDPMLQQDYIPSFLTMLMTSVGLVPLTISIFQHRVYQEYLQVINVTVRFMTTLLGLAVRPYFMGDITSIWPTGPLFWWFLRIYLFYSLTVSTVMLVLGTRLKFIPNVTTTVGMLLLVMNSNPWLCNQLQGTPRMADDMALLSRVTQYVTLGTDATCPGGIGAGALVTKAVPCTLNIAVVQVLLSFVAVAGQLLLEVFQRRAFLKLHTMHAPGHKDWPIGNVRGVMMCLGITASLLFSYAVFWQAIVLSTAVSVE